MGTKFWGWVSCHYRYCDVVIVDVAAGVVETFDMVAGKREGIRTG